MAPVMIPVMDEDSIIGVTPRKCLGIDRRTTEAASGFTLTDKVEQPLPDPCDLTVNGLASCAHRDTPFRC